MTLSRDEKRQMREKTLALWDRVFGEETPSAITNPSTGIEALDTALDWVSEGASSLLDFGCGNGVALMLCALRGVNILRGMDVSPRAIALAAQMAEVSGFAGATFTCGDVEALSGIPDGGMDGAVLWNIVDNLPPEEAETLLKQVCRIVIPGGRISIKLNAYLPEASFAPHIRRIEGNLLDDGLYLWNQQTEAWKGLFERWFTLQKEETAVYPAHDTTNRLFYLINR